MGRQAGRQVRVPGKGHSSSDVKMQGSRRKQREHGRVEFAFYCNGYENIEWDFHVRCEPIIALITR